MSETVQVTKTTTHPELGIPCPCRVYFTPTNDKQDEATMPSTRKTTADAVDKYSVLISCNDCGGTGWVKGYDPKRHDDSINELPDDLKETLKNQDIAHGTPRQK